MTKRGLKFIETCWTEHEFRHPAMMSAKETCKRMNRRKDGRHYYYKENKSKKCFSIYVKGKHGETIV